MLHEHLDASSVARQALMIWLPNHFKYARDDSISHFVKRHYALTMLLYILGDLSRDLLA